MAKETKVKQATKDEEIEELAVARRRTWNRRSCSKSKLQLKKKQPKKRL